MKGLEALKEIKDFTKNEWEDERFDFAIIEKELKALEIIKSEIIDKKHVNFYSSSRKDRIIIEIAYCVIEENKFDLLKEVLL